MTVVSVQRYTAMTNRESLQKKAEQVQREMVRYCAGIDHWDHMPVVVEGWLRVFEQLQQCVSEPLHEHPPEAFMDTESDKYNGPL
jgi:hypothetical protein